MTSVLSIKSKKEQKPLRTQTLFTIFILGFVSGLPFLLTLSTLSRWLAEVGANKTTIGLFMLVTLPYSFKFLWAPVLDHVSIPLLTRYLGKRKSWMLLMQGGLVLSLAALSQSDPHISILHTALAALSVSFFSASQDIIIDAYRIEAIQSQERGAAAALETIGFRFGMLPSGAGALCLASLFDWNTAYLVMTIGVGASMLVTLMIREPKQMVIVKPVVQPLKSFSMKERFSFFIQPFQEFPHRDRLLYIVLFIFCFKLADTVLNAMSAPFLFDMGFSKLEFATVSKLFGITLMVTGGIMGGVLIHRIGVYSSAVLCMVMQSLSCLMFAIQAIVGYDFSILMITVGVESFCSGLTAAVFMVFLSEFCSQPHTATHFTMLYSMGSFSRVLTSAGAGWLADCFEWSLLFLMTSLVLFPALYCLSKLSRLKDADALVKGKQVEWVA